MKDFRSSLVKYFLDIHEGSSLFTLSSDSKHRIKELAEEKYSSWSWNFGYSPRYRLIREWILDDLGIFLDLRVEKGIIREIQLISEGLDKEMLNECMARLTGAKHEPDTITAIIHETALVKPDQIDKFVNQLF